MVHRCAWEITEVPYYNLKIFLPDISWTQYFKLFYYVG